MKIKASLIALILLAFTISTISQVSANSMGKTNVTLSCSPLIVKAVDSKYGLEFVAEGTCKGHVLNPKNTTVVPIDETYYIINATGPFYGEYKSTLFVKNGQYKPGDMIPIELHVRALYQPVNLIPWILRHDSTNVSLQGTLWVHPVGEKKNSIIPVGLYWKGLVPVKADWVSIISGTLIVVSILLGIILGFMGSLAVKGKRLKNTLWTSGFLFGWLVVSVVASTGLKTQVGGLVVIQLLFTAVWFSSINYALYLVLPKPVKTPKNIAMALYLTAVVFSFVWSILTGNSAFILGTLILLVIFEVLLTRGIQRGLDELKVKGEEIDPYSLGVLPFVGYFLSLLFLGGIMKSVQFTLFATAFFGISLLAGLVTIRYYRKKGNIHEPTSVY